MSKVFTSCQNSTYLLFDFVLYNEILHFAPGNILEECFKQGIRIDFSASIYYLLLKSWFNIWWEKCILSFRKIYTLNKFCSSKEIGWEWILVLPPALLPQDTWTKYFSHVGIFVFLLIQVFHKTEKPGTFFSVSVAYLV